METWFYFQVSIYFRDLLLLLLLLLLFVVSSDALLYDWHSTMSSVLFQTDGHPPVSIIVRGIRYLACGCSTYLSRALGMPTLLLRVPLRNRWNLGHFGRKAWHILLKTDETYCLNSCTSASVSEHLQTPRCQSVCLSVLVRIPSGLPVLKLCLRLTLYVKWITLDIGVSQLTH